MRGRLEFVGLEERAAVETLDELRVVILRDQARVKVPAGRCRRGFGGIFHHAAPL